MPDSQNPDLRVTRLLELAGSDPRRLQDLERFRQSLVVMFSDIQGSTAYFEKHGDAEGLLMVHQCNDMVRRLVEKHGGMVIKTIGDGTMATFLEPKRAVQAATEIQIALQDLSETRALKDRIALRIGMHYGIGIVRSKDVFGDVVNTASRVENVAAPGQIVISEEIYQEVRACGFTIRELGRFTLKGKTAERALFRVIWNQPSGASTESWSGAQNIAAPASPVFRLQLARKDGAVTSEYPVTSALGIGVSRDGALAVGKDSDFNSDSLRALVFVQEGTLFVEDHDTAGEGTFLRLAHPHLLEHQDILMAGHQVFRYEEKAETRTSTADAEAGSAKTATGSAELVGTDASGNPTGSYVLNAEEVQLGRTRGTYLFPEDHLMSRTHLRITQRGEDFMVEDLGSRNGTFVKVRRKIPVLAGSALLIGGQLLRVCS